MPAVHAGRQQHAPEAGEPPVLSLLGHDPASAGAGLDQPGVVGVNARADGPPRDPLGGDELLHLGPERNAEGAPAEPRTRGQVRG